MSVILKETQDFESRTRLERWELEQRSALGNSSFEQMMKGSLPSILSLKNARCRDALDGQILPQKHRTVLRRHSRRARPAAEARGEALALSASAPLEIPTVRQLRTQPISH